MIKTVNFTIAPFTSPGEIVNVPGRLVGYSCSLGSSVTGIYLRLVSPIGDLDVADPTSNYVAIDPAQDFRYVLAPPNLPVGATSYRVFNTAPTAATVNGTFYYEDSPALY